MIHEREFRALSEPNWEKLSARLEARGLFGISFKVPAAYPGTVTVLYEGTPDSSGIDTEVASHDPAETLAQRRRRIVQSLTKEQLVRAILIPADRDALKTQLGL